MRINQFIKIILIFAAATLFTSGLSKAAELPPLTHTLSASKKIVKAPGLRLQNMDDETVDIKDLKGKTVIINFWATWCPPCRREMASLERLHLLTENKNVVILAVNIGEDMDTVFSFMGTIDSSPTFPILFDLDANSMKDWNVQGLPTTFIVDANGTIAYKAVGGREFDHPDIQKIVMSMRK